MSEFSDGSRLTSLGTRLLRCIEDCLRAKAVMTDELRHYAAVVYRARLMKPAAWMQHYPDKAAVLWDYFHPEPEADDSPTRVGSGDK